MSDNNESAFSFPKGVQIGCNNCSDVFNIKDLPKTCKCGEEIKAIKSITIGPDESAIEFEGE